MKQKIVVFLLIVMAVVFVYLRFSQRGNIITPLPPPLTPPRAGGETYLVVGGVEVVVEIADTPQKKIQGLSGHAPLSEKQGMFFPMESLARHSFWMKDMLFPLDIIWIRNNKIIDISENVPAPIGDAMPSTVQPKESADAVLELNAGFVEKYGVKIGDGVELTKKTG